MTSEARATAAETLPEEITGIVHVAPGHGRRYRIGHDSGDTFEEDDDYDGVTLTVEAMSVKDGQCILRQIGKTAAEVRARLHDDMRFRLSAELGNVIEKVQRQKWACEALSAEVEDRDPHGANIYDAEAEKCGQHLEWMRAAFEAGRALPDERAVFETFEAETGNMPTEVVAWAAGIVREALLRADGQVRYAIPLAAADVHTARWFGQALKLLEGMEAMKEPAE